MKKKLILGSLAKLKRWLRMRFFRCSPIPAVKNDSSSSMETVTILTDKKKHVWQIVSQNASAEILKVCKLLITVVGARGFEPPTL